MQAHACAQTNVSVCVWGRQEHPQICSRRQVQQKPALLFSGTPWDTNYFEFMLTVLMPLWQTATMTGLLDPGAIPDPQPWAFIA